MFFRLAYYIDLLVDICVFQAGGTDEMICCYTESLIECEAMQPRDDELIALRYELVARI